jgi:hypothetical protein
MRSPRTKRAANRMAYILAMATVLVLSACLVHRTDTGGSADSSVITEDEIDSSHAYTAFEAVYRLRPRFLASRGKISLDPSQPNALPNVYVDNQFYGDISTLRGIAAGSIESIRYYTPGEAQYKFGHGNMAGVIGIFTKH